MRRRTIAPRTLRPAIAVPTNETPFGPRGPVAFATLAFVLWDSHSWIGRAFSGRLFFENDLEGRFFLPSWKGLGLFLLKDYLGVVVLPAMTGFLFILAGAMLER